MESAAANHNVCVSMQTSVWAVRQGRVCGVFGSERDALDQVMGYPNAEIQRFTDPFAADEYIALYASAGRLPPLPKGHFYMDTIVLNSGRACVSMYDGTAVPRVWMHHKVASPLDHVRLELQAIRDVRKAFDGQLVIHTAGSVNVLSLYHHKELIAHVEKEHCLNEHDVPELLPLVRTTDPSFKAFCDDLWDFMSHRECIVMVDETRNNGYWPLRVAFRMGRLHLLEHASSNEALEKHKNE
jgi:hypothetical protein